MLFRMVFSGIALATAMMTSLPAGAADSAADRLMATRLALACPEAEMVQFRDNRITWRSEERDVAKARQCLQKAYGTFITEPFPVNMGGFCHATKVSIRKGKIILSC